jgi:ankyrin repeat protein
MESALCDDNASQEAIARAQLQRDFLSTITSVTRRPRMLKKNIRRLEKYLGNPFLDVNFQIEGISPLAIATSEWSVLNKLLQYEGVDLNFCNPDRRTSIFFAVECPRADSLRLLIKEGALLDHSDNEGRTSLSLAAELGHLDHVKTLVEFKADINLADSKSWTPLFWAVSMQHLETAKYLLSNGDVNSDHQDVSGRTALSIAAETGNAQIIRCLIDAKAKGRRLVGIERDLLLWAIFHRDIGTVQLLLEADKSLANHRVKGRTPLSMATELGTVGITKLLIGAGADVQALDDTRWPALSKWLFETYLPPDDILLEVERFSANHHPTKQPPLLLAAEFQRVDILQVLLDASADVNSADANKWTALAWAVEKRHDAVVEVLLEIPGISVDSRDATGRTPLIMAASLGEINILSQLLRSNPTINLEDEQKWTSLSWAVANGHEQTVKFLLQASGVSVDHQDGRGQTPFSLAAERGFVQIMHLLIENGADPHVPDAEGHTGFWLFLKARHDLFNSSPNQLSRPGLGGIVNPFSLQALICALPTPNKKDRGGRNWLSWAAEYGDDEVVRYFLQVKDKADKVDINICDGTEDTFSRTPLIWALEGGSKALVDLLKDGDTISLHLLVEGVSSIKQEKVLGLVATLLQAGYNPNQPDQKGRTPLHIACLDGKQDLVSALIKANADLTSRDHTGKIPLQYALKARNKAVVDLLLSASSTDLKPVRLQEWFAMETKEPSWIQITRRRQNRGFKLETTDDLQCNWLPGAKETKLW